MNKFKIIFIFFIIVNNSLINCQAIQRPDPEKVLKKIDPSYQIDESCIICQFMVEKISKIFDSSCRCPDMLDLFHIKQRQRQWKPDPQFFSKWKLLFETKCKEDAKRDAGVVPDGDHVYYVAHKTSQNPSGLTITQMDQPPQPRPKQIVDALNRGPEIYKRLTVVQNPLTTKLSTSSSSSIEGVVQTVGTSPNPNIIGQASSAPDTESKRIHSNTNRMSVGGTLNKLKDFNAQTLNGLAQFKELANVMQPRFLEIKEKIKSKFFHPKLLHKQHKRFVNVRQYAQKQYEQIRFKGIETSFSLDEQEEIRQNQEQLQMQQEQEKTEMQNQQELIQETQNSQQFFQKPEVNPNADWGRDGRFKGIETSFSLDEQEEIRQNQEQLQMQQEQEKTEMQNQQELIQETQNSQQFFQKPEVNPNADWAMDGRFKQRPTKPVMFTDVRHPSTKKVVDVNRKRIIQSTNMGAVEQTVVMDPSQTMDYRKIEKKLDREFYQSNQIVNGKKPSQDSDSFGFYNPFPRGMTPTTEGEKNTVWPLGTHSLMEKRGSTKTRYNMKTDIDIASPKEYVIKQIQTSNPDGVNVNSDHYDYGKTKMGYDFNDVYKPRPPEPMKGERHTYKSSGAEMECCRSEPCVSLPPCKSSFLQMGVEFEEDVNNHISKSFDTFQNINNIKKLMDARDELHNNLQNDQQRFEQVSFNIANHNDVNELKKGKEALSNQISLETQNINQLEEVKNELNQTQSLSNQSKFLKQTLEEQQRFVQKSGMNIQKAGLEIMKSGIKIEDMTNLKDIQKSADAIAEDNMQKSMKENIKSEEIQKKSLEIQKETQETQQKSLEIKRIMDQDIQNSMRVISNRVQEVQQASLDQQVKQNNKITQQLSSIEQEQQKIQNQINSPQEIRFAEKKSMTMNELELNKSGVSIEDQTNLTDIKKTSDAFAEDNIQKTIQENIKNEQFVKKSQEIQRESKQVVEQTIQINKEINQDIQNSTNVISNREITSPSSIRFVEKKSSIQLEKTGEQIQKSNMRIETSTDLDELKKSSEILRVDRENKIKQLDEQQNKFQQEQNIVKQQQDQIYQTKPTFEQKKTESKKTEQKTIQQTPQVDIKSILTPEELRNFNDQTLTQQELPRFAQKTGMLKKSGLSLELNLQKSGLKIEDQTDQKDIKKSIKNLSNEYNYQVAKENIQNQKFDQQQQDMQAQEENFKKQSIEITSQIQQDIDQSLQKVAKNVESSQQQQLESQIQQNSQIAEQTQDIEVEQQKIQNQIIAPRFSQIQKETMQTQSGLQLNSEETSLIKNLLQTFAETSMQMKNKHKHHHKKWPQNDEGGKCLKKRRPIPTMLSKRSQRIYDAENEQFIRTRTRFPDPQYTCVEKNIKQIVDYLCTNEVSASFKKYCTPIKEQINVLIESFLYIDTKLETCKNINMCR